MKRAQTLFLISLGCAKNLVDSEHMLGVLANKGYGVCSRPEGADVVVINTCGFVQSAVEEAVDAILEMVHLKKRGLVKKLLVAGCMVQRYGYKLGREIPEVDGWLGTGEVHRIAECIEDESPFYISRPTSPPDHGSPRIRTTPFYTAYLKIAEGCSHRCTYCIIPALRGPFRSRSLDSLVREAEAMAEEGVREINLIAQDTTRFGKECSPQGSIEGLLERLVEVSGIDWIRLLYCHPAGISDRLLALLEREERICPYLDIPFQHVSPVLLKNMGRERGEQAPLQLVERVRSVQRKISLRTTLMVGFPGETDAMFEELKEFVYKARFEYLGVFVFSPEGGAPAARFGPGIDAKTALGRRDELMRLQADISMELNLDTVGKDLPVLVEGPSEETDLLLAGRSSSMAPDVDSRVLINKGEARAGEIVKVLITDAHPYDLVGEIVENEEG